jgi:WD40 repeat protein
MVDPAMQGLFRISLSPGGEWLAGSGGGPLQLRSHDGREPISIEGDASASQPFRRWWDFVSDDLLITSRAGVHEWWQLPDVTEPVRTEPNRGDLKAVRGDGYFSFSGSRVPGEQGTESDTTTWIHWFPLDSGAPRVVGGMEEPWGYWGIDSESQWLIYARFNVLYVRSLVDWNRPPVRLGEFAGETVNVERQPDGELLAALDTTGETRMWRMRGESAGPVEAPYPEGLYSDLEFGPNGRWLAFHGEDESGGTRISMVDLTAPRAAAPLELRRTDPGNSNYFQLAFHPSGNWVVASDLRSVAFWPLSHAYPRVLEHTGRVGDVAFTPDGAWLLSLTWEGEGGSGGELRAWPLAGQNGGASRVLLSQPFLMFFAADLALDSSGDHVAVGTQSQQVLVVPVAGGDVRAFTCSQGVGPGGGNYVLAFSPDGQLLAAVPTHAEDEMVVQVWDLETGDSREFGPVGRETESLDFEDDGRLVWTGFDPARELYEERVLELETGTVKVRSEDGPHLFRLVSPGGNHVLKAVRTGPGSVESFVTDLQTGEVYPVTSHGDRLFPAVFDPSDRWLATGGSDEAVVRVGPVTGEAPHVLYGHRGRIMAMDASPDGRWIASAGHDRTVRLWPVPDLSRPPLHTLHHDEVLAKLKTLTNLRAVHDDESTTGWTIEVGPFPGWQNVPEW